MLLSDFVSVLVSLAAVPSLVFAFARQTPLSFLLPPYVFADYSPTSRRASA